MLFTLEKTPIKVTQAVRNFKTQYFLSVILFYLLQKIIIKILQVH